MMFMARIQHVGCVLCAGNDRTLGAPETNTADVLAPRQPRHAAPRPGGTQVCTSASLCQGIASSMRACVSLGIGSRHYLPSPGPGRVATLSLQPRPARHAGIKSGPRTQRQHGLCFPVLAGSSDVVRIPAVICEKDGPTWPVHASVPTSGAADRPSSHPAFLPCVQIQEVSARELEDAVQSRAKPLIIDFYATWCGPCVLQSKELVKVQSGRRVLP